MTRPSAGARFVVELVEEEPSRALYRGHVHFADHDVPLEVEVARPAGTCAAKAAGDASLEKQAAALVRAATKSAAAGEGPFPRRIARWRG